MVREGCNCLICRAYRTLSKRVKSQVLVWVIMVTGGLLICFAAASIVVLLGSLPGLK